MKIVLIEKNIDMSENLDFERDHNSRTASSIYKTGHDSIGLMKWICYYDRSS